MAKLRHDSVVMEKFAAKAHATWAFASFMQAVFGLACFYIFWVPAMYVIGPYGIWLFGMLLTCGAQVVFGLGGAIFHLWGWRDHVANIKRLQR